MVDAEQTPRFGIMSAFTFVSAGVRYATVIAQAIFVIYRLLVLADILRG